MERNTITYECRPSLHLKGVNVWLSHEPYQTRHQLRVVHGMEYDAKKYPPGTTLTVTVEIETPDARLTDERARGLNTFMRGEG